MNSSDKLFPVVGIGASAGGLDALFELVAELPGATGIPCWAIERIERDLRNHPEAMKELLEELAAEGEKQAAVE